MKLSSISGKKANSIPAKRKVGDAGVFDDDDEGDTAEAGTAVEEEEEDEEVEAPGMVSELGEAQRWWEGSAGFDFASARQKQNMEEDGMRTDESGDPFKMVGKIVKRAFGRGVVSFGKVVGWFPPEEGDSAEEVLYHVLHGDGDGEMMMQAHEEELEGLVGIRV
jgi:hypothetical protein